MKVAINACFGGFSISPKAIKWMADKQGRPCYLFRFSYDDSPKPKGVYKRVTEEEAENSIMVNAYDVDDPVEIAENSNNNDWFNEHYLSARPDDRTDPLLIECIEALGEEASGSCAELKIVEIPDGTDYEIEEYDGNEHIAEKHQTWS